MLKYWSLESWGWFLFTWVLRLVFIYLRVEVGFYLLESWGWFLFTWELRLVFIYLSVEVGFYLLECWGWFLFTWELRLVFIYLSVEVFLFTWELRLVFIYLRVEVGFYLLECWGWLLVIIITFNIRFSISWILVFIWSGLMLGSSRVGFIFCDNFINCEGLNRLKGSQHPQSNPRSTKTILI